MWARVRAALWLPLAGVGWPRKFAIGAGTSLGLEALFAALGYLMAGEVGVGVAPLALALNFPLLGYALRIFAGGLAGKPAELPDWRGWPELVKPGLFLAAVGLGYGLVPLVMMATGLNLLVRGGLFLSMAIALIILGLAMALIILFFFPMGVALYLAEDRIEAAFRPARLWEAIDRVLSEYVGLYALTVGASVGGGLVASVPFAGPLVTPLLAFYVVVAQARLFGETCARAIHAIRADTDAPGRASASA